jgi:hypothetical protein
MTMFRYDRATKWLIQHHGDKILWLGGVRAVESWRPLQAELVQPRQLPDGLLEVRQAGQPQADLFILEIATYPDQRVAAQVSDNLALVYLDRHVLPEVLVVVLHPKGNLRAPGGLDLRSRLGMTSWQMGWQVVDLWTLPAEALLATEDPGLMPWATVSHFDGPPDPVFRRCREVIEQKARPAEVGNLLAVCQVLAGLWYNDPALLAIFGGKEAMIESPVLQGLIAEKVAEQMHRAILETLEDRFGPVPTEVTTALHAITDADRLRALIRLVVRCPDMEAFRQQLGP